MATGDTEDAVPSQPIDVYKRIIDDLVEKTPSAAGRLVTEEGVFCRGEHPLGREMNDFVKNLSESQRKTLAMMLTCERREAIGEVLAGLTWWMTCHRVALFVGADPVPVDLSGMGLEGDYIGRLEGWDWPPTPPKDAGEH